jgi:FkbM family methyltransferase
MIVFDIGANRGEFTQAVLQDGATKVLAVEPAPKMFSVLARNFFKDTRVVPLRVAVSDSEWSEATFYECVEDGMSTLDKSWLTGERAPYGDKDYREVNVYGTTLDSLVKEYGMPDLVKIDVEGHEVSVLKGLTKKVGLITFEWQITRSEDVYSCLELLANLGYTEYAPQYITAHAVEPTEWFSIDGPITFEEWHQITKAVWEGEGWKEYGLRPTADAGMIWVR